MNKETVKIEVCVPAWSESAKSWCFLTKKNHDGTAWSVGSWFPKSQCVFNESEGTLIIPLWLFEKKQKEKIPMLKLN